MRAKYKDENAASKKSKKEEFIKIIYDADFPALRDDEIEKLDRLKVFEKHFPFYRLSFNTM